MMLASKLGAIELEMAGINRQNNEFGRTSPTPQEDCIEEQQACRRLSKTQRK